ncbi:hypothetical protein GPJ56_009191 [Histomonas meleagridis]|uniref:uncharacterized protein n=1 Tax=Histomonas meleagridis TaxID=135588 RepID=UPI003559F7C4|nr:hypothetical protein GPJ56_009191 [Histomonas meleagridis]KAH0801563.1 hypothetical protein GO595_005562 [Histomonas meleagridis]
MKNKDNDYQSSLTKVSKTPSSGSIENMFNMAQVLLKKKIYDQAIEKFINVCQSTEDIISLNPGSRIEISWTVLSLGYISDIYFDLKDYNKSLLFRNAQNSFLEYIQKLQNSGKNLDAEEEDNDDEKDLIEVASISYTYKKLFEEVHKAIDAPCKPPPEDPEELRKKIMDAQKKAEEEKIENAIKLLNDASKAREDRLKNSFWRRNLQRMIDHPFIIVLVIIAISVVLVIYSQRPLKDTFKKPIDGKTSLEKLEKMIRELEKRKTKEANENPKKFRSNFKKKKIEL